MTRLIRKLETISRDPKFDRIADSVRYPDDIIACEISQLASRAKENPFDGNSAHLTASSFPPSPIVSRGFSYSAARVGQCGMHVTQLSRGVGMTSASSMEKQLSLSTGSAGVHARELSR